MERKLELEIGITGFNPMRQRSPQLIIHVKCHAEEINKTKKTIKPKRSPKSPKICKSICINCANFGVSLYQRRKIHFSAQFAFQIGHLKV